MGRNLVLCFDGTSNEYGTGNTNVVKLYSMLALSEAEQIAYYQPGIGTIAPAGVWEKSKRKILDTVDLAIAWFLSDHVCAGYRFLMKCYEPGDRIFLFGFSRGAYTARVLAAMLHKVGLLTRDNDDLVEFAWDMYASQSVRGVYEGFKDTFTRPVKVHFIGVWDTVSSIGWIWNPIYLPYTANNPDVITIRHAMALDERRSKFLQNLWTHEPPPGQDVLQVWFAGDHCDVGGGHPENESGLSKITLAWMVQEAQKFGLQINASMDVEIIPIADSSKYAAPNPLGTLHNSLKGFWWIGEILPLPQYRLVSQNTSAHSQIAPPREYQKYWTLHLGRPRTTLPGACVSLSVKERIDAVSTYIPTNLPGNPAWTQYAPSSP